MAFNFNGGTLTPYTSAAGTWISGSGTLTVQTGGAIFDTAGQTTRSPCPCCMTAAWGQRPTAA